MIQISIRDLHMKTGDWVRKAVQAGGIVVADRRRPVAKLIPFAAEDGAVSFANRPLVTGFAELPKSRHDSTTGLSEDRDRP